MNDPDTAFDLRFGWEATSPFAHRLEKNDSS